MSEGSEGGRIILVPHPGGERGPTGEGTCGWPDNGTSHRRKFLRASGEALIGDRPKRETLSAWCEYEGETAVSAFPQGRSHARWHHEIVGAGASASGLGKLNTDPWIWSDGFVWTICRRPIGEAEDAVRTGDVVVFGSAVRDRWLMDTVMVVDRARRVDPTPSYTRYVAEPLAPAGRPRSARSGCTDGRDCAHDELPRPVAGRSFEHDEMPFSFFPAQTGRIVRARARVDITPLLRRLRLEKAGTIPSAKNSQARAVCIASDGADRFWIALRERTLHHRFVLGLQMHHPLDQ